MKMTVEMSTIDACAATACAYNLDQACHARAITIGEGMHPACDTYVETDHHVAPHSSPAGVGACKVEVCRFNQDLECGAASIALERHEVSDSPGHQGEPRLHADCVTFERRDRA